MLAMENVIRRAVSGMPLELHYPTPTPSLVQPAIVQRSQAQGKAATRRKSARDPPQKKMAARTPTPPITTWRQIRSAQQVAGNLQAAKEAVACVEERYKLKMRERPSQSEQTKKRKRIESEPSEEEDEEEEEREDEEDEKRLSNSSGSDNTADDPGYKRDPREEEDDHEDDDGDDDGGDVDWFK